MAPRQTRDNTSPLDQAKYMIKNIQQLLPGLDRTSMPEATPQDMIWIVLQDPLHDTASQEWVRKFDVVMGSDTRNENGRFSLLRKGRKGLMAFCSALVRVLDHSEADFTRNKTWPILHLRLDNLENELKLWIAS
jgi:hypothetical protein